MPLIATSSTVKAVKVPKLVIFVCAAVDKVPAKAVVAVIVVPCIVLVEVIAPEPTVPA